MWQAAAAVCHFVVFLDMRSMGSHLLKAKGTQKLSLLLTFSVTLSPVALHRWTRSVPGEVGRNPILACVHRCPSAMCHKILCVLFAGIWSWQADQG